MQQLTRACGPWCCWSSTGEPGCASGFEELAVKWSNGVFVDQCQKAHSCPNMPCYMPGALLPPTAECYAAVPGAAPCRAKRRRVNDAYVGTLSSYAYVLMCISHLQVGMQGPASIQGVEGITTEICNVLPCCPNLASMSLAAGWFHLGWVLTVIPLRCVVLLVCCAVQGRDPPVLPVLQELPPTHRRTVGEWRRVAGSIGCI